MQTVTPGASRQEVTPIADGTRHFGGDWESVDEQAALSAPLPRAARTPSPGPTPARSTPHCSTSCATETRPHATQRRGGSHERH